MRKSLGYVFVSLGSCGLTYLSIATGLIKLPPPDSHRLNLSVADYRRLPAADEESNTDNADSSTNNVINSSPIRQPLASFDKENNDELMPASRTLLPKPTSQKPVGSTKTASKSNNKKSPPPPASSSPQIKPKYHSLTRFVFVAGLEGTGHHFMGDIAKESPAMKTLQKLKIAPGKLSKLSYRLYNNNNIQFSLMNAHCKPKVKLLPKGMNATNITVPPPPQPNLRAIQNMLVKQLKEVEAMARNNIDDPANNITNHPKGRPIHLPLNTAQILKGLGMISYPNYGGPCRKLNYPSLDLLYRACDMAQVDCGHVYIYRDPLAILRSTTENRNFGTMLEQIHLYKSMYKIIASDLLTFPERTWGCFGLLDSSSSMVDMKIGKSAGKQKRQQHPTWWEPVSKLWGWESLDEFNLYMNNTYRPPRPIPADLVSPNHEPYMQTLEEAHRRVIRLCRMAESGSLNLLTADDQ